MEGGYMGVFMGKECCWGILVNLDGAGEWM